MIVIAIALIGGGAYLTTRKTDSKSENNKLFYDYPESMRLKITNCKTEDCEMPAEDNYDTLVINSSSKKLTKKIEKINNDTKQYYEQVKNSTTDNERCTAVKDKYYHEQRVVTNYYNYENEKYISIAVQRNIINLCTNEYNRKQIEWYLYDKSKDKLLTQQEFKEAERITDQEITSAIENIIKIINDEEGMNIVPGEQHNDIVVFYDFQGEILISAFIPEKNLYYTGTVRQNIKNSN